MNTADKVNTFSHIVHELESNISQYFSNKNDYLKINKSAIDFDFVDVLSDV